MLPELRQWEVIIAMGGKVSHKSFEGHDMDIKDGVLMITRAHVVPRSVAYPNGIRVQLVVMIPPGVWGPITEVFTEELGKNVSLIHTSGL